MGEVKKPFTAIEVAVLKSLWSKQEGTFDLESTKDLKKYIKKGYSLLDIVRSYESMIGWLQSETDMTQDEVKASWDKFWKEIEKFT